MNAASVVELEPGDALFIPSMWWHHIKALSPFNLMVNHWWCSTPASFGSPSVALLALVGPTRASTSSAGRQARKEGDMGGGEV